MTKLDDLKREYCALVLKDYRDVVAWLIDHLHAQGRIVPDGYVAVPLEPTEEMCRAGENCDGNSTPEPSFAWEYTPENVEIIYKAMIAAAQKVGG